MRKLSVVACVCFLVSGQPINAQYYYYDSRLFDHALVIEIGPSIGVMNSLTDLGGKKGIGGKFIKDLRWKTARLSYGVYVTAMYKDAIGIRLEGTFGEVAGYDSILRKVASSTYGRFERNLSFKSKISEFHIGAEIHPLFFKDYGDDEPPRLSPYAIIGAGLFSFDPQANLNGQWYSLQPLHLEGQGFTEYPDRKIYQLNQLNILAGLGLKYEINSLFNARLEFVHRFLFTDYLDDVSQVDFVDPTIFYKYLPANKASIAQQLYKRTNELNPADITYPLNIQRGDPSQNDSYFTIQLKIGMMLGRQKR